MFVVYIGIYFVGDLTKLERVAAFVTVFVVSFFSNGFIFANPIWPYFVFYSFEHVSSRTRSRYLFMVFVLFLTIATDRILHFDAYSKIRYANYKAVNDTYVCTFLIDSQTHKRLTRDYRTFIFSATTLSTGLVKPIFA